MRNLTLSDVLGTKGVCSLRDSGSIAPGEAVEADGFEQLESASRRRELSGLSGAGGRIECPQPQGAQTHKFRVRVTQ
jgi:hypothetical protein